MADIKVNQPQTNQVGLGNQTSKQVRSYASDGLSKAGSQVLSRGMNLNTSNPFALPVPDSEFSADTAGVARDAGERISGSINSGNGGEGAEYDLLSQTLTLASAADTDQQSYNDALSSNLYAGDNPDQANQRNQLRAQEQQIAARKTQLGSVLSNQDAQTSNAVVAARASELLNNHLPNVTSIAGLKTPGTDDADPFKKLVALSCMISSGGAPTIPDGAGGQTLQLQRFLHLASTLPTLLAQGRTDVSAAVAKAQFQPAINVFRPSGPGGLPPGTPGSGPGSPPPIAE